MFKVSLPLTAGIRSTNYDYKSSIKLLDRKSYDSLNDYRMNEFEIYGHTQSNFVAFMKGKQHLFSDM